MRAENSGSPGRGMEDTWGPLGTFVGTLRYGDSSSSFWSQAEINHFLLMNRAEHLLFKPRLCVTQENCGRDLRDPLALSS